MAAFCLDESLETLRLLCYRGTHRLQGGISAAAFTTDIFRLSTLLWHFRQATSSKTVHGVEVWTPRGPILCADKGRNVPPQPLPVDMFSSRDTIFCFQGEFQRIRSRTGLIVASALTLSGVLTKPCLQHPRVPCNV